MLQIEDVGEEWEGQLVKIEGELTEKKGSSWWLDDRTDEVKVYIKRNTQIKSDNSVGNILRVVGIVSQQGDEYRILPRYKEDVRVIEGVLGDGALNYENVKTLNQKGESGVFKYLFVIMTAVAIVLATVIARKKLEIKN